MSSFVSIPTRSQNTVGSGSTFPGNGSHTSVFCCGILSPPSVLAQFVKCITDFLFEMLGTLIGPLKRLFISGTSRKEDSFYSFFTCACVCKHVPRPKVGVRSPGGFELLVVGVGNQTLFPWSTSDCSSPLSHPFGPLFYLFVYFYLFVCVHVLCIWVCVFATLKVLCCEFVSVGCGGLEVDVGHPPWSLSIWAMET